MEYAPSSHLSERTASPLQIALVSTSPPRQCGIATFTSDLARSMQAADPKARLWWAAINEEHSLHPYGQQVRWRIRQRHPDTYRCAAAEINESNVDIVSIQHEFGLFGIWGETFEDHLVPFLETLTKPLVTTLHTTLPEPSPSVREAVQRIGSHSNALIVMANRARTILEQEYGIDPAIVHVIPHGVPPTEARGRRRMKQRLGLEGRSIISTFGLVSPRKGLEYMVRAMTNVIRTHPNALYLIVGKTHPELVRQEGEAYRTELTALVRACGLDGHVAFVDEYLSQQDIVDYLLACDIYVTPYLDPNQITSGTLAYALGAGKAIVSTPYLYANEVLAEGRGLFADFRSADGLADEVLRILYDRELKNQLELDAYAYGRDMAWPRIGEQVIKLFREVVSDSRGATSSIAGSLDAEQHDALPGTPNVPPAALALAGSSA